MVAAAKKAADQRSLSGWCFSPCKWLRRQKPVRYWCGDDVRVASTTRPSEIRSFIALFIFVIGQWIAALVTEHTKGTRYCILILYYVIGAITIKAMIVINRSATEGNKGAPTFIYDGGTRMVAKWVIS